MRTLSIVAVIVCAALSPLSAQQPASLASQIRVATPTYFADGEVRGASAGGFARLNQTAVTYATAGATLCHSTSAVPEPPTDSGYGWRVEITPLKETGSDVVVQVAWQRAWERGQRLDAGRRGSAQLTLKSGGRAVLDFLSPPTVPDGTCTAVGMGLEVRVEGSNFGSSLLQLQATDLVETELWLVQQLPDGTERSEKQSVRTRVGSVSEFFFDASKPSDSGLTFSVLGKVAVTAIEDGKIRLKLTIARRTMRYVWLKSQKVPAGPKWAVTPNQLPTIFAGSADFEITVTPSEVTSFSIPATGKSWKPGYQGAAAADPVEGKLSLRVRARQIQ
jgi:hypothetical protein